MKSLKFIIIFLSIGLCSCSQEQSKVKHKINPVAIELNNQAMTLVSFMNIDSARKAIILLDRATTIDSNYFLGYYNKLLFLNQLKQYNRSIQTIHSLIRIKPWAHDLYLQGGILYEQVGDTIESSKYFQKSLSILDKVFDTMNVNNPNYEMLIGNKAINLVMIGEEVKANKLLKDFFDKHPDSEWRELTSSFMNKTKKELLEFLTTPEKDTQTVNEVYQVNQ